MPPTEQIIWEAKHKPGSLKGSRRPSTVVDASGCRVTRGFILPSRSSSRDSSVSSHAPPSPGIPASPLEDAAPGFFRPSGSLYHAPEMAILRSDSNCSLHKPSRTSSFLRPPQLGGRSKTFHGRRASCWYNEGSDSAEDAKSFGHLVKLQVPLRRTQSDHTGLISIQAADITNIEMHTNDTSNGSCAIFDTPEVENAIASDNDDDEEDEDDFIVAGNSFHVSGIAAQRSRPTYAQRRAISDQRVTRRDSVLQVPPMPPVQQFSEVVVSTTVSYVSAGYEEEIETPIEVKSFADEEIVPAHALRPSRSRPRPAKGVLKHAGSRSSSEDSVKHVHTAISRGSGSVVNGRLVMPEPAPQVK